jgi:hypothetical protein
VNSATTCTCSTKNRINYNTVYSVYTVYTLSQTPRKRIHLIEWTFLLKIYILKGSKHKARLHQMKNVMLFSCNLVLSDLIWNVTRI